MARRTTFVPYTPRTILNKARRADSWFWTRYSAYPYIGCQHGCAFCYCRERKYSPYEDPEDFAHVIKVKENAPELLRRALGRVPIDTVFTGDYQPAERKFEVSKRMLQVCRDLGFPVFVLERSPLVLRDLELLQGDQRRRAVRGGVLHPHHAGGAQLSIGAPHREAGAGAREALCRHGAVRPGRDPDRHVPDAGPAGDQRRRRHARVGRALDGRAWRALRPGRGADAFRSAAGQLRAARARPVRPPARDLPPPVPARQLHAGRQLQPGPGPARARPLPEVRPRRPDPPARSSRATGARPTSAWSNGSPIRPTPSSWKARLPTASGRTARPPGRWRIWSRTCGVSVPNSGCTGWRAFRESVPRWALRSIASWLRNPLIRVRRLLPSEVRTQRLANQPPLRQDPRLDFNTGWWRRRRERA